METNEQGLTKEEKIMFLILGIILLVAIGVLIINSLQKEKNLDNNETPIVETSGQEDKVVDDNINEPEDILIEEESDNDEIIYYPVVNIPSSSGTNIQEDQSIPKPTPQPVVLDWTFKDTMVTNAFSGDVITIDKNVLLTNGQEQEASVVVMKLELYSWITQDISSGTLTVQEGLYKYIYSYGSSTKELLLTVRNKLTLDTINILTLNETIDETSSITIEEFTKYQTIISNSLLENVEGVNNLTINNYIETNNLLPLVLTTNEDLTNKVISTNTLGITITKEQKDWYEEITPNSMIIWLDLNTIDITNNVINIDIDGVIYNLEIVITINEESTDTDNGELEDGAVDTEDNIEDDSSSSNENLEQDSNEENIPSVNEKNTLAAATDVVKTVNSLPISEEKKLQNISGVICDIKSSPIRDDNRCSSSAMLSISVHFSNEIYCITR